MANCNFPNRTIFCKDNIDVLRGIDSECIDLIYLDPPFNKNKEFAAPIGSSAEGASFRDIFREEDLKDEWLQTIKEDHPELYHYLEGIKGVGNSYNFAYLSYMAIRLIECRRVMKSTASIYLHCDQTMSHYIKSLMDCIFGEKNFRSEILWQKNDGRAKGSQHDPKQWGTQCESIFFYVKTEEVKVRPYIDLTKEEQLEDFPHEDDKGRYKKGIPIFCSASMGARPNLCYTWRGYTSPHPSGWRLSKKRLEEEYQKGNVVILDNGKLERRLYLSDYKGKPIGDLWLDISPVKGKEATDYPTQKPLALLERIIKASSNEGDMVLDPFCGCATTCVAAEKLDRKWVGIDVSIKAYEQVQQRMAKEVDKPQEDWLKGDTAITFKASSPRRTDLGVDYREQKFVYVISHPAFPNEYKVGIAKDCKSRLNAYQTSDPDRQYKIEYKRKTAAFRQTEAYIHRAFPNKHEWVQGDLKDIIKAIEEHAEIPQSLL